MIREFSNWALDNPMILAGCAFVALGLVVLSTILYVYAVEDKDFYKGEDHDNR